MNGVRLFITIINERSCFWFVGASHDHAMSSQAPPAALILFSAVLEKSLALTMHGICGSLIPLPSTLKYPYRNNQDQIKLSQLINQLKNQRVENNGFVKKTRLTECVTSMTGAMSLLLAALFLVASETRDQSLSVLIVGQKYLLFCLWKTLIPSLPQKPGWLYCDKKTINQTLRKYLLFVHHDSFVMHTTGLSSTTWRLSVLSDSTMSHRDVSSQISHFFKCCWLQVIIDVRICML